MILSLPNRLVHFSIIHLSEDKYNTIICLYGIKFWHWCSRRAKKINSLNYRSEPKKWSTNTENKRFPISKKDYREYISVDICIKMLITWEKRETGCTCWFFPFEYLGLEGRWCYSRTWTVMCAQNNTYPCQ